MSKDEIQIMFEAIKAACVMAIYSGDMSLSAQAERDSCASKIRLLTIRDVSRTMEDKEHE